MQRVVLLLALILTIAFAPGASRVAAATQPAVRVDAIDISAFPDVHVGVAVAGADAKPVRGLKSDSFEVTQSGFPVTSLDVAEEPAGAVDLVIAIDTSGSMVPYIDVSKSVALDFLNRLRPEDRAAVTVFDERADPVVDALTADRGLIRDTIAGLTAYPDRNTAFYSGLYQAIRLASESTAAGRAVIVLSDGEEAGQRSAVSPDEIRSLATGRGVQVYTVYVGRERPSPLFEEISNLTGGMRFDSATGASAGIGGHLDSTLRTRYAVRFVSASAPGIDPKDVTLTVKGAQPATASFSLCQYSPQPVIWLPQVEPGRKLSDNERLTPQVICAPGRPVQEMEFFIDGKRVDTASAPHFDYQLLTDQMERGQHSVRIEATLSDGTRVVSPELAFIVAGNAFNPAYLLLVLGFAVLIVAAFLTAIRRRRGARRPMETMAAPVGVASGASTAGAGVGPGTSARTAQLRVVSGPNEGQTYPIASDLTLGRSPAAEVFLSGSSVSREHARILRSGDAYQLRDLGSTNGTRLNGRRVTEAVLSPGDRIEIPPYVLEFGG